MTFFFTFPISKESGLMVYSHSGMEQFYVVICGTNVMDPFEQFTAIAPVSKEIAQLCGN